MAPKAHWDVAAPPVILLPGMQAGNVSLALVAKSTNCTNSLADISARLQIGRSSKLVGLADLNPAVPWK